MSLQGWLQINWKKQNETSLKAKPVLLVKDIVAMQGKLDRELLYLINKAKYYVPKPKPVKTNTTGKFESRLNPVFATLHYIKSLTTDIRVCQGRVYILFYKKML